MIVTWPPLSRVMEFGVTFPVTVTLAVRRSLTLAAKAVLVTISVVVFN